MSGFKLLAIRPLKGCSSLFSKGLVKGSVYKFYQNYSFFNNNDITNSDKNDELEIVNVKKTSEEIDLHSINKNLKINISTVVGKNGSGKSTLLELFFLAVYLVDYKNIIKHKKKVEDSSIEIDAEYSYRKILKVNEENISKKEKVDNRTIYLFNGLKYFENKRVYLEIYYEITDKVYKLLIDTNLKREKDWFKSYVLHQDSFKESDIVHSLPFYSIALNYSIHSLNTIDMGKWLDSIFHKNDGYQTPLVINPKREEGNIDINNERGLQKSRLLINTVDILKNKNNADPLFNSKELRKIVFKYKYNNNNTFERGKYSFGSDKEKGHVLYEKYYKPIQKVFDLKEFARCSWIEKKAYCYINYKVFRIKENYKFIFNENNYEDSLRILKSYSSHITYKLQQGVNFIKNESYIKLECEKIEPDQVLKDYYGEGGDKFIFKENPNIIIEIKCDDDDFLEKFFSNEDINLGSSAINFIPPPLFEYDFCFSEDEGDTFEKLSSGEKQQIYSIHTIMYHLRNLSSVKNTNDLYKYKNVNILLDEIELYFHPEMQRTFIKNLLNGIKQLEGDLKNNINAISVLIVTHSPFILSDIPHQNVLKLDGGKVIENDKLTFGANIHNLLVDSFFLKEGAMGEYAKLKINETIVWLNYRKLKKRDVNDENEKELKELEKKIVIDNKNYHKNVIEVIGEPILKLKLNEMFNDVFREKEDMEEEELKRLADKLGYNISKKDIKE